MTEVYRLANLDRPAQIRDLFQRVIERERGALVAVKLHMGRAHQLPVYSPTVRA